VGDRNHLMLIRIQRALELYRNDHGDFPPLMVTPERDGNPPFSWRVAILPYMGQIDLYKRYDFAQPWNGVNNLKLLSEMPDCYADAIDTPGTPFASVLRVATRSGGSVGLDRVDGDGVTDGELLLIMTRKTSIPWTRPEDLDVPEIGDLGDLLDLRSGHHALTIDPDGRTLRYAFLVAPPAVAERD